MKNIIQLFIIISFFSCSNSNDNRVLVDFTDSLLEKHNNNNKDNKTVHIAIASITSPKETYTYYGDLINYLSQKVKHPIYIKQKETYEEVNLLLENSEIDFAFICSGAFVSEYKRKKIKLLAVPQIDNKTYYHAYIIAHKESNVKKIEDLKNKKFAFTDPLSNTGRLYPLKKLKELNITEEEFFLKTIYTYGHDISIQMVNRGIIDGASINSLIYNYLLIHNPKKVENIRIISKSERYGNPPIVVPASLSNKSFVKYQKIFLNLHKDSLGKSILDKLEIDKFVVVDDTIYNSVFQMKKQIDNEKAN